MSNLPNPPVDSPADWLRHARSDLAAARLLEKDPDILPNQVAFHAQQAAEKAIKGAMMHRGILFPKTHDLKELVTRWTRSGETWPANLEDTKTLTSYAVETRYPGYIHPISRAETSAAIEVASKVLDWAEAIINVPPPSAPYTGKKLQT